MSIKEMQQLEELYKEQLRLSTEEQAYAPLLFSAIHARRGLSASSRVMPSKLTTSQLAAQCH